MVFEVDDTLDQDGVDLGKDLSGDGDQDGWSLLHNGLRVAWLVEVGLENEKQQNHFSYHRYVRQVDDHCEEAFEHWFPFRNVLEV